MNLPNLITLARLGAVPVVVWLLLDGWWSAALVVFVAAGVSDGVDGFIAKRWNMRTVLGAYLDPLADKALLVSLFVTLGALDALPAWLVVLVVSRDVFIIGAVVLSTVLGRHVAIAPLFVSKANTTVQIALVGAVLFERATEVDLAWTLDFAHYGVAGTTVASGGAYLAIWLRDMSALESDEGEAPTCASPSAGEPPLADSPPGGARRGTANDGA